MKHVLTATLLVLGCLGLGSIALQGAAPVTLQYVGHACFLLTSPGGTTILMDPYLDRPSGLGPVPAGLTPAAVTISHEHADHDNTACVPVGTTIVRDAGRREVGDVVITGFAGQEGSPFGATGLPHVVFLFETGGVKIAHLGDSGPVTDPAALTAIANAHVVIVNVDGYVFPRAELVPFMASIQAKTIVPVHYSIVAKYPFFRAPTADQFLATLPAEIVRVKSDQTTVTVVRKMPSQVLVLTPSTLLK